MKTYRSTILTIALALVCSAANATGVVQSFGSHASLACDAALNAYAINPIRERPLAVQNEGTDSAFVTCAFSATNNSFGQESVQLLFVNHSSTSATINCTAVIGVEGNATYLTRSIVLVPGERNPITFNYVNDNGGNLWTVPMSMSCLLPAGTAVTDAGNVYRAN